MIPKCGTGAGYRRHRRGGEQPCVPCMAAHAQERSLYLAGDRPATPQSPAELEIPARRYDAATWMPRAACADTHVEVFFPERGGDGAAAAKKICGLCPVRRECLEYALEHGERYGVWGGKSEKERRILRGQRRRMTSQAEDVA